MIVTSVWAILVLLLFGGAASIEMDAVRKRINGANGLIYLVCGFIGLASIPFGFILLWIETDLWTALWRTLAIVVGGVYLWRGLLAWIGRAADRQRR